jgi:aspartyl-tRNA(Asn)/glutamyl-tRNA(Gln) amidotransferase subunit A
VFGDAAPYHAAALEKMPERYTTPVRLRLEMARYVLAEDYTRALEGREALRREVDTALSGYDALMLPTVPIPAPPIGASTVDIDGSNEPIRNVMLRLTQLFNITGHPAISLPCGKTSAGLPCGLQLVGTRGQTDRLLHVAGDVS